MANSNNPRHGGQAQHSAYQDNQGQFNGHYGAPSNSGGHQQHGAFDTQHGTASPGYDNSGYAATLRGDYGYGPHDSNYENAARKHNASQKYSFSQANIAPRDQQNQSDRNAEDRFAGPGFQQHDPHYLQWREEQIRSLDNDYRDWHNERYKNFSNEFDVWRKNRKHADASEASKTSNGAEYGSSNGASESKR